MSQPRADLNRVQTIPFSKRKSKVHLEDFPAYLPPYPNALPCFPPLLKGKELWSFINNIRRAKKQKKPFHIGMGAHVIKCGLSRGIIRLMEEGWVTGLSFNGAAMVHEYEIAFFGATSERVEDNLPEGSFGFVKETCEGINQWIKEIASTDDGLGEGFGKRLLKNAPHADYSLIASAARLNLPVTIHIAMGTDIYQQHPGFNGAAAGIGCQRDFSCFVKILENIGNGGVYLNLGSAVILPEVFLKALTCAINLGSNPQGITTAVFDMNRHYRPMENVLRRPTQRGKTGESFEFVGHHEILLPLLITALLGNLKP